MVSKRYHINGKSDMTSYEKKAEKYQKEIRILKKRANILEGKVINELRQTRDILKLYVEFLEGLSEKERQKNQQ